MEKNFVAAVVRDYEAEALVLDYFLDCSEHAIPPELICPPP
jgi:hypothetical protein